MTISLIFTAAFALGCLHQFKCNAELPAVGKCPFMEYYCTLREYESYFFMKLYKDSTTGCGLQFWILYYRSLHKAKSCLSNSKGLEVTNVKEIQLKYCSGLDLEIPLMASLSPCSDRHKNEVDQCINDFAITFSNDQNNDNDNDNTTQRPTLPSLLSLCRKRAKAKMCTIQAWRTFCNQSDMSEGIFKQVIGGFNPYCKNDKDPWVVETDPCAGYRIPYRNPECDTCPPKLGSCPTPSSNKMSPGILAAIIMGSIFGTLLFCVPVVFCVCWCCGKY